MIKHRSCRSLIGRPSVGRLSGNHPPFFLPWEDCGVPGVVEMPTATSVTGQALNTAVENTKLLLEEQTACGKITSFFPTINGWNACISLFVLEKKAIGPFSPACMQYSTTDLIGKQQCCLCATEVVKLIMPRKRIVFLLRDIGRHLAQKLCSCVWRWSTTALICPRGILYTRSTLWYYITYLSSGRLYLLVVLILKFKKFLIAQ